MIGWKREFKKTFDRIERIQFKRLDKPQASNASNFLIIIIINMSVWINLCHFD
jgi:hypothetical protein